MYVSTRIWKASSHACPRCVTHATHVSRKPRIYQTPWTSGLDARLWEISDASVACVGSISTTCDAPEHTYPRGIFSRMPQSVTHAADLQRKQRVFESPGTSGFDARIWETSDAFVIYMQRICTKSDPSEHTYLRGIYSRMPQISNASHRSVT